MAAGVAVMLGAGCAVERSGAGGEEGNGEAEGGEGERVIGERGGGAGGGGDGSGGGGHVDDEGGGGAGPSSSVRPLDRGHAIDETRGQARQEGTGAWPGAAEREATG